MLVNQKSNIKVIRIIARSNVGGTAINSILLIIVLDKNQFDSIMVTSIIGEGDISYLAEQCGIKPIIIAEIGKTMI